MVRSDNRFEKDVDLDDLSDIPTNTLVFLIAEFVLELEKRYAEPESNTVN